MPIVTPAVTPAATLADRVRAAIAEGRRVASAHSGPASGDALPWTTIAAFDADVRGHVERDRRIEDERDRVLIAAVTLGQTRAEDGPDRIAEARRQLVDALDYLEQAVLRFGLVNRVAARLGYGEAGDPVATRR